MSWQSRELVQSERDSVGVDDWVDDCIPTSKSRLHQINEAYCTSVDLEKFRAKFKDNPWFIDIFLTTPNYRFPYVHICVLCKKVYEGFTWSAAEFVEAIGK